MTEIVQKRLLTAMLVLAATIGSSACIPFPRTHYYSPAYEGRLTKASMPAAGIEILLESNGQRMKTMTEMNGQFKIGPIDETRWLLVGGDQVLDYTLSVKIGSRYHKIDCDFGLGKLKNKKIEIAFDLNDASIDDPRQMRAPPCLND